MLQIKFVELNSRGHMVVQLVEALRYKLEGHVFDSWWCHWYLSLTLYLWPHYGPGVDSASNRNEYQEYFLGKVSWWAGLTNVPPSCINYLEICKPQPLQNVRACWGLYRDCCTRMGLLGPAWCKLFSVILLHLFHSTCFGCNIHPSSGASYNAHAVWYR